MSEENESLDDYIRRRNNEEREKKEEIMQQRESALDKIIDILRNKIIAKIKRNRTRRNRRYEICGYIKINRKT